MTEAMATGVPTALVWMNGRPIVTVRDLPARPAHEPFWDHTLRQATGRPRLLPLDHAPDLSEARRPAGSIFHMQRCGSTLACHLLGRLPGVVALSEPMIFQALLSGPGTLAERRVWLRQLMALHASSLCRHDESLVIKWSSVSVVFEPEIASAFPDVPAVFAWRDPVEVLVSCLDGVPRLVRRLEPRFFAPHLRPTDDIRDVPLAELLARYHGSCCHYVCRAKAMRLLDYRALPDVVWEKLAAHFRLPQPEGGVLDAIREHARIDAKDRKQTRVFTPDSDRKQAAASMSVRALVARWVAPDLEALRARHAPL